MPSWAIYGNERRLGPGPASVVSYTGPGDIVSGGVAWWGLRAYNTAFIGSAAIRVLRSSDSTEKDIVIAANGIINVSDSHFDGSATYSVVKLYDQTGNGRHIDTPNVAVTYPTLTLNDNGSLPRMNPIARMNSTLSSPNMSQPFSVSTVARRTTNDGQRQIAWIGHWPTQIGFDGSNDTIEIYNGGGNGTATGATEGSTFSIQALYSNAASKIAINGSSSTTSIADTNSSNAQPFSFPADAGLIGKAWEAGWWASDISSSFAAISANQRSVWNF